MENINTTTIVIVAVIILVLVGLLGMALNRFQRTRRLRDRFGPEYDRTLDRVADKRQAEEELASRLARVQELDIRPLSAEEVNRFALEWQAIQTEFVDQPLGAVQRGDRLIQDVMRARGYPVDDFEQRAADISVDYPDVVMNYRELHEAAARGEREKISTEEMRQAMVNGRELFERLVQANTNVENIKEKERI
jgi:hypothetical protein